MGDRIRGFWQRVNDYGNDETRDPFSHSNSYHRHFQGYAEQRVPGKNGKGSRIERIYVAEYYRYEETDAAWKRKKLGYALLFALAAAISVIADSRQAAINRIPAVGIAQMLSFLPMIYLLYGLILQLTAPRQMTIGERDSAAAAFRKGALICACTLLAVAVAMPAAKWSVYEGFESADWAVTGLKALSAAPAFILYFTEKRRKLKKVPNTASAQDGANEIW